ncbi:hypothetical protein HK405_004426 [Cladochytrium tenue]|nr:hypothetical protein HK405_004426 [Cladochytrium tenue]
MSLSTPATDATLANPAAPATVTVAVFDVTFPRPGFGGAIYGANLVMSVSTDSPAFRKRQYGRLARTSDDLERLFAELQALFPDRIIPIPPSRSMEPAVYQACADAFLKRVMAHPVLCESDPVKYFIDKESSYLVNTGAEVFATHEKSAQSALRVLNNRLQKLADYDQACKSTQKKLLAIDKLRGSSSIRHDRVDSSLDDLKEAKRTESVLREDLRRQSDVVRSEYDGFEKQYVQDVRKDLDLYVAQQLQFDMQVLSALVRAL